MSGYIGTSPVPQATQTRDVFTATASQTTFATSGYSVGFLDVYVNGSHLKNGTDYTASNGSDVVMVSGLTAGDYVEVVAFSTFSTSDTVSASGGGTFSGPVTVTTSGSGDALTITSTDAGDTFAPDINFYRNSSSPADNDGTGLINFKGRNDNDQDVNYVQIQTAASDVSDGSENGAFSINTMVDGSLSNRLDIASTGKIGINEGSPSHTLHVNSGGTNIVSKFESTDSVAGIALVDDAGSAEIAAVGNDLAFYPAGSEKMRLFSNGNVEIGSFNASGGSTGVKFDVGGGTSETEIQTSVNGTATRIHYAFRNDNGEVGKITTNGSATTYATSSDYRLKENVTDVTDGITRLKQLAPKRFNFIADADKTVDGFIAHEVSSVVPEAIAGEKDEVDADGNPKWQGIDQSKLVPLLTAALQEAITKIETLETKVAALEAE